MQALTKRFGYNCSMNETEFYSKLLALPEGANDVWYNNKRL